MASHNGGVYFTHNLQHADVKLNHFPGLSSSERRQCIFLKVFSSLWEEGTEYTQAEEEFIKEKERERGRERGEGKERGKMKSRWDRTLIYFVACHVIISLPHKPLIVSRDAFCACDQNYYLALRFPKNRQCSPGPFPFLFLQFTPFLSFSFMRDQLMSKLSPNTSARTRYHSAIILFRLPFPLPPQNLMILFTDTQSLLPLCKNLSSWLHAPKWEEKTHSRGYLVTRKRREKLRKRRRRKRRKEMRLSG